MTTQTQTTSIENIIEQNRTQLNNSIYQSQALDASVQAGIVKIVKEATGPGVADMSLIGKKPDLKAKIEQYVRDQYKLGGNELSLLHEKAAALKAGGNDLVTTAIQNQFYSYVNNIVDALGAANPGEAITAAIRKGQEEVTAQTLRSAAGTGFLDKTVGRQTDLGNYLIKHFDLQEGLAKGTLSRETLASTLRNPGVWSGIMTDTLKADAFKNYIKAPENVSGISASPIINPATGTGYR